MGGFAGVFRGALAGLNEAAGNSQTAAALNGQNEAARQQKQLQLRQQVIPHAIAIKGLQTKLSSLDPNDPHYHDEQALITNEIARNLAEVRQIITPDKDSKGNFFERGITDKLHMTSLKRREALQKQRQQQGSQQDQSSAAAIAQGTVPAPLNAADQSAAARIKAGIDPKAESKANYKNFKGPNGEMVAIDVNSAQPPPGYVLADSGHESSDTRARSDFDEFKKNHPDYKGTFESWKTEQAGAGRNASKPLNRDDRYIAIEQKRQAGQALNPDETAYSAAYDLWLKKTKVDPGIARAAAFGADRYIPVIDPTNSENVTFMRAGDAAREHAGSPASIGFQTDKALTRAFTSGQPAQTINYFNTATEHLKQLQQAADALQNNDIQTFNRIGNHWATETGNPAPTNFATIRNAVAGELSKTFKGAAATDAEIDAINTSINSSQSPAQLSGAIGNNLRLMGSKMEALRGQYEAGKRGEPNFPTLNGSSSVGKTRDAQKRPASAAGTVQYQGKSYWVDKDGNNLGPKGN